MAKDSAQLDALEFALLVAHQLQSPIAAAGSILKTVLGGYYGKLTEEQQASIAKAGARCDQAIDSVHRMLAIAKAMKQEQPAEVTNLAASARVAHQQYSQEASGRGIALLLEIDQEPAHARLSAAAVTEVLEALIGNALKYTPDHGQIRLSVRSTAEGGFVRLSVADSGVGIAEQDRERIFQPFFRSGRAQASSRAGTGLGLTFVKTIVEAAGGAVRAGKADLGGAEIVLDLPAGELPAPAPAEAEAPPATMRVLIIGGVAAGPKIASKVIRLDPRAEVTIVEKGKFLSYAGCGLPYYVSDVVKSQRQLMSTPVGVVRDAVFFHNVKNVQVRSDTEAIQIDRAHKRVLVRDLLSGAETWLDYDRLALATGATPIIPQVPGVDMLNIFTLHGVHDAEGIRLALATTMARDVVMLGGGLIGVEFTGSLVAKGCRVTIVETREQILRILDWEMARLVERHLESNGVRVLTDTHVRAFEGDGRVSAVVTDKMTIPADLVILAIGVRPNVSLARQAGLEIGPTGGIRIDRHLRTSDPDIFAAGDCVENLHMLTGRPCYIPLGSTANKHGRAVAVNLCGGSEVFPGVLGTTLCRVFDYCVARTGLTEEEARELGYDVTVAMAPGPDTEHFMPPARPLLLKIVVDAKTRRLLGAQGIGPGRADKRIDVAAMAIAAGMTVDQLANTDLGYAPHYSPAMDNLITAANVARNKLDGYMDGISAAEVHKMLTEQQDFILLDVRTPGEYEDVRLPGSTLIPLGALRARLEELPRDKPIVTFCNVSLRGYEAALILKAHGFRNVRVLDGGTDMWPYRKLH